MLGEPVIFERHDPSHGAFFHISELIHQERSDYQEILVFENPRHGRVLFIDGQMMFTETTWAPYNEAMAQIPLHLHPEPRRVLIVGGGDGCVLKSVLRHPGIEAVTLAELDGRVIEVTKQFLPDFGAAFDDPRVTVRVGDGARYVRETEDRFDICIIDSTDPYLDEDPSSVATPLAQPEFYEGLRRVIGERGIASQILGHHYFYPDVYPLLIRELRDQWRQVEIALVAVPFYISGRWSLGIYSQTPFKPMEPRPCETECDWYNADVHRAAFCHPNDLKRFLARLDES